MATQSCQYAISCTRIEADAYHHPPTASETQIAKQNHLQHVQQRGKVHKITLSTPATTKLNSYKRKATARVHENQSVQLGWVAVTAELRDYIILVM